MSCRRTDLSRIRRAGVSRSVAVVPGTRRESRRVVGLMLSGAAADFSQRPVISSFRRCHHLAVFGSPCRRSCGTGSSRSQALFTKARSDGRGARQEVTNIDEIAPNAHPSCSTCLDVVDMQAAYRAVSPYLADKGGTAGPALVTWWRMTHFETRYRCCFTRHTAYGRSFGARCRYPRARRIDHTQVLGARTRAKIETLKPSNPDVVAACGTKLTPARDPSNGEPEMLKPARAIWHRVRPLIRSSRGSFKLRRTYSSAAELWVPPPGAILSSRITP